MTPNTQRLLLIAAVLLGANILANYVLNIHWRWFAWGMYPAFVGMQILAHRYIMYANAQSAQRFITAFMATTGIKLLSCLVIIGGLVLLDKPHAKPIVVWFILLYFALSVYETIALSQQARKK